MKKPFISIHHSIYINRPKDVIWDYTQDYAHRSEWDKSILEATILQTTPYRIVRLKLRGGTTMNFVYKLDDRPNKTSLAIQDVESKWIAGGGGSWSYENNNEGTLWSQTNTLLFKSNIMNWACLPILKFILKRQMRKSMLQVKLILER